MDLELGESEQRQPGEVDRPEVGVVVWLDDGRVPLLVGEPAPQTLQLVVALPQRADDVGGALAIPRLERPRALPGAALGVEGGRTTSERGGCHLRERFAAEAEVAGDGQPAPAR